MNAPEITFKFKEKGYSVSYDAYYRHKIVLPDGTALAVLSWKSSFPPMVERVEQIHLPPAIQRLIRERFGNLEIAAKLNAAVAIEIPK